MNWVDFIILGSLIFFALESMGRPLILELLDFTSFLLSFFISFRYYNFPASFISDKFHIPHGLSLVLGFMAMWFICEIIFSLLVNLILPSIQKLKKSRWNFLSIMPALLKGLIFIALTLVLIATFPIQPSVKKAVLDSKIGNLILKNAYQLEGPVKQIFGGVTNDTLTFLTIEPKTDESVDLGFKTTNLKIDEAAEMEMIMLVNNERTDRGTKALVFDSQLMDIARAHSMDMFKQGYFSHFSPEGNTVADRAEKAGIDYLVIGENLAFAPNVSVAHRGLMKSEGHKANILSTDFGRIGIGIMDGGVYGEMFTQVFSN